MGAGGQQTHLRAVAGGASTGGNPKAQPYGLTPGFEAAAVTALCKSGSLWSRLGSEVDSACLSSPVAQLALKAATEFAKDVGRGPGSLMIVLQRLARWRDDGKLAQAKLEEVSDFFDAAEDAGLPHDDAIVAELAPVLQLRARQAAVEQVITEFRRGEDLAKAEAAIARARSIGKVSDAEGSVLGGGAFESIDALRLMERLGTGIFELDLLLDGGLPRGLTLFVGSSGAGKSMALAHVAAEAVHQRLHVGVVTLELSEELQLARIIANLTGTPINDLLQGRQQRAKDRLEVMLESMGTLAVRYFSPKATTVADIVRWVEQREARTGQRMHLLVVDYIDKLGTGSEESSYKAQGDIADQLRDYALTRSLWCLTASQTRRSAGKSAKAAGVVQTDLDDIADSLGKPRVADVVVTLRKDEEAQAIDLFIAKNRLGRSRTSTGPLTQDEACGRIVTLTRGCGW